MTVLFALGTLNALLLAVLLGWQRQNRLANRLLAGMLLIVAARLSIYLLGYADAYDRHPALSFLPLDLSAGLAPLLWLYVTAMTGPLPARWRWHLLPAALQWLYQAICFLLPMPQKWNWYSGAHLAWVEPLGTAAILVLALPYLAMAWRRQQRYQTWLDAHFADRDAWRLDWLRAMLALFAVLLAAALGLLAWSLAVTRLGYAARTPLLLGACVLAYLLGLLGWKHAGFAGPKPQAAVSALPPEHASGGQGEALPEIGPASDPVSASAAAAVRAERWIARIEAAGWWREEGLTLGEVARRLGTSERSLSRALRDAGAHFNATINAMRVAAVQRALADPQERRELLALALDHGFASKASFNRAFRAHGGLSPSAWRLKSRQATAATANEAPPAALDGSLGPP